MSSISLSLVRGAYMLKVNYLDSSPEEVSLLACN